MRLTTSFLSLPASILLLIVTHTTAHSPSVDSPSTPSAEQWPYNLPPHVKFWPEDPPSRRRDLEAIEEHIRLGREPVGVMKMSDDEGEKFYMEYWQFEGELEQKGLFEPQTSNAGLRRRDNLEEGSFPGNDTLIVQFKPPFMLHTESTFTAEELKAREILNAAGVLAALEKRDFTCPTGTSDCSGIGFSGSCCALDPAVVVTTVITRTFTVTAASSTRTSTSVSTPAKPSTKEAAAAQDATARRLPVRPRARQLSSAAASRSSSPLVQQLL
ncbi:hypothetical protein IFR05_008960 [Cadophora sp. M221]|nr:hypothetical protein IFR05_008960 [Cadophora sp. M221]